MTIDEHQPSVRLRSGAAMPLLGFGTWQIQGDAAQQAVRSALDVGYRHIDTATVYGNEDRIGRAVVEAGVAREELFITTKLPPDQGADVRTTIETSLRALRTDYVDLWLIHWPPRRTSAVALFAQMLELQAEGKARALGVSNFETAQIDDVSSATGAAPEVDQIPWSPFLYDRLRGDELMERGVVLEGYSPFKASRLRDRTLREIAAVHGVSSAQVVLRWHIEHGVVAIPKSVHLERIVENFDVFDFQLDPSEMRRIDALGSTR